MWCSYRLPYHKCHKQNHAQDEWSKYVSTGPLVLVASPLHAHHEQKHSTDGEEAAHVVDLGEDFLASHALTIDTRRRVIEDCCQDQADESPKAAPETNPAPC
jgi:hypothetical protein